MCISYDNKLLLRVAFCAGAMNVSDVEASLKSLLMASNRAGAEQQAALPQHAGNHHTTNTL